MLKTKLLSKIFIAIFIVGVLFSLGGCQNNNGDNNNVIADNNTNQTDKKGEKLNLAFGKKYYYVGYVSIEQDIYYLFNADNTATYTHVMKEGSKTTFHQQINFKWFYGSNGNIILVHNGTKMIKGEQDDAFGISRVMNISNEIVYWGSSGENAYFINEDFINTIPDYAKLIK